MHLLYAGYDTGSKSRNGIELLSCSCLSSSEAISASTLSTGVHTDNQLDRTVLNLTEEV
jgi:hypothetical protein